MKTLRYIGTALSATVLCMSLTACSDDDEEQENETSVTQKHITSQQFLHPSGAPRYSASASYDDNNRLTKIVETTGEGDDYVMTIDYDKSQIVYTMVDDMYFNDESLEEKYTFKLNGDGCIVEITETKSGNKAQFTYDSEKHLTSSTYSNVIRNYTETTSHTWRDGNLMSIDNRLHNGGSISSFTYSGIINKGNIQPFYGLLDNSLWSILPTERTGNLLLSSGLFGKQSRNLPSQISQTQTDSYGSDSWTNYYTYQLDSEGFVSSMSSKSSDGETETAVFSYRE